MTTNALAVLKQAADKFSSNPANRQQREFNTDKTHAVGQFLRAHPDALRVIKRMQHEARAWNSLRAHLVQKGYGA